MHTIYSFPELPGGCRSYKELITETLTNNIIYHSGTLDIPGNCHRKMRFCQTWRKKWTKHGQCIKIDDEPLICRLIHKLGNWNEFDIEISAICFDGESALEEISRHKPDIVLSDIRVPIYNGIEIMEETAAA